MSSGKKKTQIRKKLKILVMLLKKKLWLEIYQTSEESSQVKTIQY